MLKYIIKRLLMSVVILIGVSFLIYALVQMMPSDYITNKYAAALAQGNMTPEDVERIKAIYGLNDGLFLGYGKWLLNFFRGNLGDSFIYSTTVNGVATRNVVAIIKAKMPISFVIAFIATVFEFIIAIPLGIVSATKQYSFTDYFATVLVMMGISLPTFFLGALLMRVFSLQLKWLPLQGLVNPSVIYPDGFSLAKLGDMIYHLILPILTLIILSIGGLMRYTRTNMLEVLNADYIRTARAKGLSEHTVIYKHAFRNTLIPLVTMFAGILPSLFGGAMITETVFGIPGVGLMAYDAVVQGDIPLIMADNMFLAFLSVIGVLLSDLMYVIVDPRVKLS